MSLFKIANPVLVSQTLFVILVTYVKKVLKAKYKVKRLKVLLGEVKKKMTKSKKLKFNRIEILKYRTLSILKQKEEELKSELTLVQPVRTH